MRREEARRLRLHHNSFREAGRHIRRRTDRAERVRWTPGTGRVDQCEDERQLVERTEQKRKILAARRLRRREVSLYKAARRA